METHKNIFGKSGKAYLYNSLGFLAFVLILTLGLFGYSKSIEAKNTELDNVISGFNDNIKSLESDEKLQVYSLLKRNEKVIDRMSENSKITKFITHVNTETRRYNLEPEGFNFSGDTISMGLTAPSGDVSLAYQKVKNFIKEYRESEGSLLELAFINSVSGFETIKFPVQFKIKN